MCEHVAVYAGFPRAINALAVVDEVVVESGIARPPHMHPVRLVDHETVVAQRGDYGPPVVLIHALGLDWRMWDPVMTPLSAGRRVLAYDVRGHGWAAAPARRTRWMTRPPTRSRSWTPDIDRAHVVGLSYGGGIAQTAAVAHLERFLSLALLATTDYPFDAFEARASSGKVDGMQARVVPSLTRWFTPAALALDGWGCVTHASGSAAPIRLIGRHRGGP